MKKKPYGGILSIQHYLMQQYGKMGTMIKRGRPLTINTDSMETISGRRTRNCSVVAVTRVIDYYRQKNEIQSIPGEINIIYKKVEEIAEILKLTPSNVLVRLHRGRSKLKEVLAKGAFYE